MKIATTAMAVLAAAIILGFAPSSRAADTPGEVFQAKCGKCHTAEKLVAAMKKHGDAYARTRWLDRRLRKHFAPDRRERARIISFLEHEFAGSGK